MLEKISVSQKFKLPWLDSKIYHCLQNLNMSNSPNPDFSICVTGKQCASVCTPTQTGTIRYLSLLVGNEIGPEVGHNALALQIPNLHTLLCGGTEPVPVGAKAKSINNIPGIQRVQPLPFRQVPKHSNAVFTTAGAKRAVGRNGSRVHIAAVPDERVPELTVSQIPYLYRAVP